MTVRQRIVIVVVKSQVIELNPGYGSLFVSAATRDNDDPALFRNKQSIAVQELNTLKG